MSEQKVPALVVQSPFRDYERGALITDPATIEEILAGPHASHVTRTRVDPEAIATDKPAAA